MHHVVLDTKALRGNHLYTVHMKLLKRLIEASKLKIYIPEIVKNEYITQKQIEFSEKLNARNTMVVESYFTHDNLLKDKLMNVIDTLKDISLEINKSVEEEFDQWANDLDIDVLKFDNVNMTKVMDDYFSGGSVFKSIKNRNDIPDSMICVTIEDLSKKVDNLTVIVEDKYFNKHLTSIGNINTFNSLQELLDSQAIKNNLEELDLLNEKYEKLHKYLISDKFKNTLLADLPSGINDVLEYIYLEKESLSNVDILCDNIFASEVEGIDKNTISNFRIFNAELVDDNQFYLNIEFSAKSLVRYWTEYENFLEIENSPERDLELGSMKSDGATQVYEHRVVEYKALLYVPVLDVVSENPEKLIDFENMEIEEGEGVIT